MPHRHTKSEMPLITQGPTHQIPPVWVERREECFRSPFLFPHPIFFFSVSPPHSPISQFQSTNQPINQSVNQSDNQIKINQSIRQSISQSVISNFFSNFTHRNSRLTNVFHIEFGSRGSPSISFLNIMIC